MTGETDNRHKAPERSWRLPAPGDAADWFAVLATGLLGALLLFVLLVARDRLAGLAALLAAAAVGAVLALLFAIPRRAAVIASRAQDGTAAPQLGFVANTSLEEISDWITKTIVGVSLVSWNSILARLDQSGQTVGMAVFGCPAASTPAATSAATTAANLPTAATAATGCAGAVPLGGGVALLVGAAGLAGLAAYIWFARYLPVMFVTTDSQAADIAAAASRRTQASGLAQQKDTVPAAADGFPGSAPTGAAGEEAPLLAAEAGLEAAVAAKLADLRSRPRHVDDWCKDMFGGQSGVVVMPGNQRRALTAQVETAGRNWYRIVLSLDAPGADRAAFFLHNTFPNTTPMISLDAAGRGDLAVEAYGAFTVGVLTDDGATALELDLAMLPDAPRAFRDA